MIPEGRTPWFAGLTLVTCLIAEPRTPVLKYHKVCCFKQLTIGLFKLANKFIKDVKEFESKVKVVKQTGGLQFPIWKVGQPSQAQGSELATWIGH